MTREETHTHTHTHMGFELLQDPTNSPNSAPSDFYLFPKLKSHLPCRQFENN